MQDTSLGFMPIANNSPRQRTRIEPGEYHATCVGFHEPGYYEFYKRWYMRFDFAIQDDGQVVSRYLNMGRDKKPKLDFRPQANYYKLWVMAVGRKPEHGEPMDPAKIIGLKCLVDVVDHTHKTDGSVYSRVESIRGEVVGSCNASTMSTSSTTSTDTAGSTLSTQATISTTSTSSTTSQAGEGMETLGDFRRKPDAQRTDSQSTAIMPPPPVPQPPSPLLEALDREFLGVVPVTMLNSQQWNRIYWGFPDREKASRYNQWIKLKAA